MRRSKIPLQKWLFAMYLLTSNPKGASSLKIARELNIPQNTAWMMAQKIREGWIQDIELTGTVEVDETFIGGKESIFENQSSIPSFYQTPIISIVLYF